MPHYVDAWNLGFDFGYLLTTTPGLDLAVAEAGYEADLTAIFNAP